MTVTYRFALCLGLALMVVQHNCDLRSEAPSAGFVFTGPCSATETERVDHMIAVGQQVVLVIRDDTLWQQAARLLQQECEVSLLKGE